MRKQNEAFQRLKDRLFSLHRDRANRRAHRVPRNAGRRAPDQAPTPCETVGGAWDSSLAGMEYRKSFTLRIINYEKIL